MSYWWYSKDKEGKRWVTSISIPYELFPFFLCLIMAIVIPPLRNGKYPPRYLGDILLLGSGFILFFSSKLYQFKTGIWISWGWRNMPLIGKIFYLCGYLLMIFGALDFLMMVLR
ncbi:MAG: hypothetical protein M0036_24140 [Desulfobacteraceae bacterium]|nr:hypothetical protein [Desulfobacteraceae bacterium]